MHHSAEASTLLLHINLYCSGLQRKDYFTCPVPVHATYGKNKHHRPVVGLGGTYTVQICIVADQL